MEKGKPIRKNVAAGRRLRPLRHTRQMSAQPTIDANTDKTKDNNKLDSIDSYIEHVSLENDNCKNNHTALHSALESLKGRVHHARAQSVKRSQSKQRQGGINSFSNCRNTNTTFANTTTTLKTCTPTESILPPRSVNHRIHQTNSVISNSNNNLEFNNSNGTTVMKEFLSASMPLHNTKDNLNNAKRIKLRRSNSKHVSVSHSKEHNAWGYKKTNNNTKIIREENNSKEIKANTNTNIASHGRRTTPAVKSLLKRNSAQSTNALHTTNQNTDHVEQNEIHYEQELGEQNDSQTNVVLPFAPNDMDEEYYTNKANWETNLPEYVIQLLQGEMLNIQEKLNTISKENEWSRATDTQVEKEKGGYFACIQCHTPICALHNQITLPQTLTLPLLPFCRTDINEEIESCKMKQSQWVAFRCIDHHAITLTLNTAIKYKDSKNNNNNNYKRASNEELHIMVHCVHCNGRLGELTTMFSNNEHEWEVNDVTYVYVAYRACLKYMPFRTQHELNIPIDLMLCCNEYDDDEEDKGSKQHNQKKNNINRKDGISVLDDDLFQLSWHSSDLERDVFYSLDDEDNYRDDGYM